MPAPPDVKRCAGDRKQSWRRLRFSLRVGDGATSDIVGTMMIVGVTVTLVAATSLHLLSRADAVEPPDVRLVLGGTAGESRVLLTHGGGDILDASSLRAIVTVDEVVWYDGAVSREPQPWRMGESLPVALGGALRPEARVGLSVIDLHTGATVATGEMRVPRPVSTTPAASSDFTVSVALGGGLLTVIVQPPAELLVEASVHHREGRKFVRYVHADVSTVTGPAWVELRDDGTYGDRLPGDGVYSGLVLVPLNVTSGEKEVVVTAIDFNGTKAQGRGSIGLLKRVDVTEEILNPTLASSPEIPVPCPPGRASVTGYRYVVNGVRNIRDLTGNIREGDHVKAYVTIAASCSAIQVSLVSYKAPAPYFTWSNAYLQRVHEFDTKTLGPGEHTLEVNVPSCYFQIDLVTGPPIFEFGPANSNNFYSRQGRLLDADNGGTRACT